MMDKFTDGTESIQYATGMSCLKSNFIRNPEIWTIAMWDAWSPLNTKHARIKTSLGEFTNFLNHINFVFLKIRQNISSEIPSILFSRIFVFAFSTRHPFGSAMVHLQYFEVGLNTQIFSSIFDRNKTILWYLVLSVENSRVSGGPASPRRHSLR